MNVSQKHKRMIWYAIGLLVVLIGLALYFNQVVPVAEDIGVVGLEKAGQATDFVINKAEDLLKNETTEQMEEIEDNSTNSTS